MNPTSYTEANATLLRDDKPVPTRKIANNTYVQRRRGCCAEGQWCFAVRLHQTDIVTFHIDATITLSAGGWYTRVTNERINRYLPSPLRVISRRGRWMIALGSTSGIARDRPFFDGITLYRNDVTQDWLTVAALPARDENTQDEHNKRVNKLIHDYLTHFDALTEDEKNTPYDVTLGCGMCVRTDVGMLVGDEFEDKQHLIEHLIDKTVPANVWIVASERVNPSKRRLDIDELAKRDLAKYLRQQLYVGAVAIKNGKRLAHTQPWRMSR